MPSTKQLLSLPLLPSPCQLQFLWLRSTPACSWHGEGVVVQAEPLRRTGCNFSRGTVALSHDVP